MYSRPYDWIPTHQITDGGCKILVMLDEGRAYTQVEWQTYSDADYERQEDGSWTFMGRPFPGTVQNIAAITRGRLGGKVKSAAKTAAVRRNALLGGRPKKEKK